MKKILALLLFAGLLIAPMIMAQDAKLTALPALTTPTSDDLLYAVDDPAGTPVSKKLTVGALQTFVLTGTAATATALAADGANCSAGSYPLGVDASGAVQSCTVASTGDVVGPGSATDKAITRFNTTTGKLLQNSGVIINDANEVTIPAGTATTAVSPLSIT